MQDERRELVERSEDSGGDEKIIGELKIPDVDLYEEGVRGRVGVGRGGEAYDQEAQGREDVGKGG